MKIVYSIVIGLTIVAILAALTKPSDEACRLKATAEVKKYLNDGVDSQYALINNVIDSIAEEAVSIEDYVFYKQINYSYNGGVRTIGFGFFGIVYIDEL